VVDVLGVLECDHDGCFARIEIELERRFARVREQAPLEVVVDPRTRDEPGAVGRGARDEPVHALPELLACDDPSLDEEVGQRADASGRRRVRGRR
jgi:hypothetical protein